MAKEYIESTPETFIFQDVSGKMVQLSSTKLSMDDLILKAKEFVTDSKTTKSKPPYT